MVQLQISHALFQQFPQLQVGVIVLNNFNNHRSAQKITQKLRQIETEIREKELDLEKMPEINVWREAYSWFGAKPKKYKSSVEALVTRVMESNTIPSISPLVDAYNYVSLKYKLPWGADDLSVINEDIALSFASGKEFFREINGKEEKNPERGEVVYKMGTQILCRRWNWRESDLTKITPVTTQAILYCENLLQDKSILEKALKELQSLIGGEMRILNKDHNVIDLGSLKVSKNNFQERYMKELPQPEQKPTQERKKEKFKRQTQDTEEQLYHWSDVAAEKVIQEKGDKKNYTVAAGITPSGVVHIGNFREIITVDLVKRALEKRGKKVRFIYSWDNFDVFRKVPKNMPKPEVLQQYLRQPIIDTPDTYGCHNSYAEHHQAAIEEDIPAVGITPEFLYQAAKYRKGEYVEEIKKALENTETIKGILNQYRDEAVEKDWLPITMFCEKCGRDTLTELQWMGGYNIKYRCECSHAEEFNFKKKPILKLKWRVDWPMRWDYEQVDFEPGGKDHSTVGGSFDTGKQIVKAVWKRDAPTYVMYDFIQLKGGVGKMSSSSGEVITLKDVLEVYEPEIVRFLFAGTRPNKEFAISFDADVLKIYEDFDKCERIYFGLEQVNEKETIKQKVAYELSYIGKIPATIPYQPGFRHLTTLLQIHNVDVDKTVKYFEEELKNAHDKKRVRRRAECAKNWLLKYAPEEFRFTVQEKSQVTLAKKEKDLLRKLAEKLMQRAWTDVELHEEMYILCKNNEFPVKDFFTLAYRVLINKERGPRLAAFILAAGKEKVAKLLRSL